VNTAQKVRLHKEKHPELYCPKCLWKTNGGYCPRHKAISTAEVPALTFEQFSKHDDDLERAANADYEVL